MKKLLILCLLIVAFVNIQSQTYNSSVVNQIDGYKITILNNEIDSITISDQCTQKIWTKDSVYITPISSISSTTFEKFDLPGVLVKTDEIGVWSEMRIATDGSLMMKKDAPGKNYPEDMVLILPSDNLGVLYSCAKFDEGGMPKYITVNECIIYVDAFYDNYVDLTIAYNDTISYSLDSLSFNDSNTHEYASRRSWSENNWQRNLVGIVELASGAAGVVGGALLVTGSVVSEAGTFGASTPISVPGILAGSVTIAGGVSTFNSGWDKLFTPGENRSNVGETLYSQAASELIANGPQNAYIPDQYWAYLKDPNYSRQLSRAGWISFFVDLTSDIFDNMYGLTVTTEDIRNYYQGKVLTGLNMKVTTNTAIVRGYISPSITRSLLNGSKVENEYGIVVYSTTNGSERYSQKVSNGDGGMIEYQFDHLKPFTTYNYRTYYMDKTNGVGILGDLRSFQTLAAPPEIVNFNVTNAEHSVGAFENDGQMYDYCFNVAVKIILSDTEDVEDWGYIYIDPDGKEKKISLSEMDNPYTDRRYAYYRNEARSTATLVGYVKYFSNDNCFRGEVKDFDLIFGDDHPLCPDSNHPHMIDLGLPSGTKWACCNIGADYPCDYGAYFAWGETYDKYAYGHDQYEYNERQDNGFYTYTDIGTNICGTGYDAATAWWWWDDWKMPTTRQAAELLHYCIFELTTNREGLKGSKGFMGTGPNGNKIFLPFGGQAGGSDYYTHNDDEIYFYNERGFFWTGETDNPTDGKAYQIFSMKWDTRDIYLADRYRGRSVRAVIKK